MEDPAIASMTDLAAMITKVVGSWRRRSEHVIDYIGETCLSDPDDSVNSILTFHSAVVSPSPHQEWERGVFGRGHFYVC